MSEVLTEDLHSALPQTARFSDLSTSMTVLANGEIGIHPWPANNHPPWQIKDVQTQTENPSPITSLAAAGGDFYVTTSADLYLAIHDDGCPDGLKFSLMA